MSPTRCSATLNYNSAFSARLPIVVGGERRFYDVHALKVTGGSAGIAIDASEATALRDALVRMAEAHRRTLDQLSSGVAVFDGQRRLAFYNDSYRRLWDLDRAFLDGNPDDSSVLDRLRAARKLQEQPDFRAWKAKLHEAYRAIEPAKDRWYLPDGRAISVVTTPNPEGGVTYLFDDVTESLELARQYDGLINVQRETLDNLAEAVAVFGSNGRAQLFNPAFAKMWKLSPEAMQQRPHIETVEAWCRPLFDDAATWQTLREAITGIENRIAVPLKLERKDGSVLDCMTMPLPDGATMLTFQDITDSENVERALREHNEALEAADQMKLNFVRHVSYELRSPLTSLVGFTYFLNQPGMGPFTPKQAEYLGYVTNSTNALLALVDNILTLATIDAGAMTLELGPIDIRKTIEAAAKGIQDRLATQHIELKIDVDSDIGEFIGDENRLKQVLYNLLSNAVGFSPQDAAITVSAKRTAHNIVLAVSDSGPGIPADVRDKVFDWFESHSNGSQHRGAGLGLSLVKSFVELHGGRVYLDPAVKIGTTIICEFPADQAHRNAAE
jgi:signal transduction histidine kinase